MIPKYLPKLQYVYAVFTGYYLGFGVLLRDLRLFWLHLAVLCLLNIISLFHERICDDSG